MTPVLLAPTVGKEVVYTLESKGEPVTDNPLRCLLKPHPDGGYVLLVVNLVDAIFSTTFTFPAGFTAIAPLFENRDPLEIEPEQTSFTDHFEPFDVHVYHIMPRTE